MVGFGGGILAQEAELPDPGLTPDSPFYFLEVISEEIGTFFTFGDLKKAERYAVLTAERVAEAKAVVEKGKSEFAEKALKRYEDQLNRSLARAERAKIKGISIEKITETVAEASLKHLSVLEEVLEKVPEEAKESITKAKEASVSGQKNSLRFLAEENPERATEINLKAAEARLNRAKAKVEEDDIEEAENAIKEFENFSKFGEEISAIAKGLGKDTTTVEQLVGKATSIHLEVLADVYERVPEKAKPAIEKAMEVLVKGHEKTVEALKAKDAIDEVPEEASMPEKIPEEVQKRIREKVKKEIEEELEEELKEEEAEVEKPGEEKAWPPEDTSLNTYQLTSDFSKLCDEIYDEKNGKGPIVDGKRRAGSVDGSYSWDSGWKGKVEKEDHMCKCTATVTNVSVDVEITITLPQWEGYGVATEKEKAKWDKFIEALKEHENGHVEIYKNGVEDVKAAIEGAGPGYGLAETCEEACDKAAQDLKSKADQAAEDTIKEIDKEQEEYDDSTNHGENQGATLDCTNS